MRIIVNGEPVEVAEDTLSAVLGQLGYGSAKVATAVNESFVATTMRDRHRLAPGDCLEIVTPRQGG
jgi:sulfur carrier protein